MILVKYDLLGSVGQIRHRRIEVRLPHIHGYAFDSFSLLIGKCLPKCVNRFALPTVTDPDDLAGFQVRDDRKIAMALLDRLLVDADETVVPLAPAFQTSLNSSAHDAINFVPSETEIAGDPGDRHLGQEGNDDPLEERGKAGFAGRPGNRHLQHTVLVTVHAWYLSG